MAATYHRTVQGAPCIAPRSTFLHFLSPPSTPCVARARQRPDTSGPISMSELRRQHEKQQQAVIPTPAPRPNSSTQGEPQAPQPALGPPVRRRTARPRSASAQPTNDSPGVDTSSDSDVSSGDEDDSVSMATRLARRRVARPQPQPFTPTTPHESRDGAQPTHASSPSRHAARPRAARAQPQADDFFPTPERPVKQEPAQLAGALLPDDRDVLQDSSGDEAALASDGAEPALDTSQGVSSPGVQRRAGSSQPQQTPDGVQPGKWPGARRLVAVSKRDEAAAAVEVGLASLGRRALTCQETRTKLLDKGFTERAVQGAIDRLLELGELDDARYAALYINSKWKASQRSAYVLEQELTRRGVDKAVTKDALQTYFGNQLKSAARGRTPPAAKAVPDSGLFDDSADARDLAGDLVKAAQSRLRPMANLPKQTQVRRLSGWLQRRGHDWDTVSFVLRQVGLVQ